MKVDKMSISMIRGDTESIVVSCTDSHGIKKPFLYGDKVYFTVKESVFTDVKLIQKVITDFVDGTAIIEINPEDTKSLKFKTYVYDVQWTKANGVVTTIISPSDFIIESEVTYE